MNVLEQLISGTFPVNIEAFYDAIAYTDEDKNEDILPMPWIDFSEVLREVSRFVRIYCGNGHTTSRVSAGMIFLSHGVVAAGRIHHNRRSN